jgi:ABC-type proline/glycine betaine transport system permease subunit
LRSLWYIELPLAAPTTLAGIKTAAVNIGTATLAAYCGLGDPIITGLALYDPSLILAGVIPAALLAIATELAFEGLEKLVTPKIPAAKDRGMIRTVRSQISSTWGALCYILISDF